MKITIPMPLLVVVEDVGWWSGTDGSRLNQPFRTAMGRRHCPEDYKALAALGKRLGMRLLAPMVLCEWDRANILKELPTATWMGSAWNNSENQGPWLEQAGEIIRKNEKHLEVGLHGVGHEYWAGGKLSRSEFHDEKGTMRPDGGRHLEYFARIIDQHRLGPFPRVFVPPALNHSFGNGKKGFQAILETFGVRYVSTIFKRAKAFSPPIHKTLTWECGVLLMERGEAPVPWHHIAAHPTFSGHGPLLTLHWANILHPDPARNMEVVNRWADFLIPYRNNIQWFLAPDAPSCWTQFAVRELAAISPVENGFRIDLGKLADLPAKTLTGDLCLNIGKPCPETWEIKNGRLLSTTHRNSFHTLKIQPDKHTRSISLTPGKEHIIL